MTVFSNASKARTADFNAGDVGYVPKTLGHYIENIGDTDLVFVEMFKADRFMDLSLSERISSTPPELIIQHLGPSKGTLDALPKTKPLITPV
jgi:oxalate decarboxylase